MTNRNLFSLACLMLSDIEPNEDKYNINASYKVNIYEYVGFFSPPKVHLLLLFKYYQP